ncbi:hypothetical protein DXX93_04210 [Thalassotalea euphylliae]|uniref:Uncharacterized protein n=1 Tax=Thalassotalea euphylliae TaxID=1655234 RepID=A0A3E0TP38_9GAMM|nr:hypothetical protein [Thalassotalea euphylliae]REL25842.1 hypothetical protein DXX93_04210 [Thalassotalea euphylliae]
MTQSLLWQDLQQSSQFAELCNALYEREVALLARVNVERVAVLQSRLQSLSYYVQKAAHAMVNADTPMTLDSQNASWSSKQTRTLPTAGQEPEAIAKWYLAQDITLGLVVPVEVGERLVLDCVDRFDKEKSRVRTNVHGWFELTQTSPHQHHSQQATRVHQSHAKLLKPTKKAMMASCAGHVWQNNKPCRPVTPTLRELLLSCAINWKNLKKPLPVDTH